MEDARGPSVLLALALARLPRVGRRRLRQLLASATGVVVDDATGLMTVAGAAARRLRFDPPVFEACRRAWDEARRLHDTCARHGWHVWIPGSADFPAPLLRLADPPALLFVHGPARLPDRPRLAVVGTREPTPWGLQTAETCARVAAGAGALVVSGLAWGIDTAAHRGALEAGGQTWATLPGALDMVYPRDNQKLAARIVESGGALVSEYVPGTRPHATFFVERDRLQAALSDAVLVVETGRSGGTQHTIRFAHALQVPVWVTLPESARQADARVPEAQQGTWDLWRAGTPAMSAADVERWARGDRGGTTAGLDDPPPRGRLF